LFFAKKGARTDKGPLEEDSEVNYYREVLADKFKNVQGWLKPWDITIKSKIPRKILHPHDIHSPYPPHTPMEICDFVLRDWDALIRDIRYGEFRYYSRSIYDYISALSDKTGDPKSMGRAQFMEGSKIPTSAGFKNADNPAFDRRALVDPGRFGGVNYIGRKKYDDKQDDIKGYDEKNPYPALSTRGMSVYLPRLTKRDVDDFKEASKYISIFLRDTKIPVSDSKLAWQAMGSLGEEEAAAPGESGHP